MAPGRTLAAALALCAHAAASCVWSLPATRAPWPPEVRDACCGRNAALNCRSTADVVRAADDKAACVAAQGTQTGAEAAACCAQARVACVRQADCFDAALATQLTARERLSCCRDHDQWCGDGAAATCAAQGLGCPAAWWAEQAALDLSAEAADARQAWVSLRLRLRGDSADVLARPKRQLALVRRTLLRGMPALRAAPEALVVTEVGVLAPGATLPQAALRAAWSVRTPREWGRELREEEVRLVFDDDAAWKLQQQQQQQQQQPPRADGGGEVLQGGAEDDGFYVEFYVVGTDRVAQASVDGLQDAVQTGALRVADASAQTAPVVLADGQTGVEVVASRVADVRPEGEAPPQRFTAWSVGPFVAAAVAVVVVVGVVAVVVTYRSQRRMAADLNLDLSVGEYIVLEPIATEAVPHE